MPRRWHKFSFRAAPRAGIRFLLIDKRMPLLQHWRLDGADAPRLRFFRRTLTLANKKVLTDQRRPFLAAAPPRIIPPAPPGPAFGVALDPPGQARTNTSTSAGVTSNHRRALLSVFASSNGRRAGGSWQGEVGVSLK
jgi:hypothetical protein